VKQLYLYIIDGFPAIAVSHRTEDALHVKKRVYYKLTGATVLRFFALTHKFQYRNDKVTGTKILTISITEGD